MAGVALACEAVVVRHDGRAVLRVPSLSVEAGGTLVLLGPNGAGKSTLLGVLAGLDRPDEGAARIGGEAATGLAARRRVALLPQRAPMLRGRVIDNVALPLALRGVGRAERERRASEALERLGVAPLARRMASQLSGGETRRVAVARALVTRPEALLLDEPLEGVDPELRERLHADLLAAARHEKTTLVLVTHARDEAVRTGGAIALLWEGEVRLTGPLDEILRRATPGMAQWLGESNLVRVTVTKSMPDGIEAALGGRPIRIAGAAPLPEAGAEVWIVVPRESIEIRTGAAGPTSARNVLPATVTAITPREGRTEVTLEVAGARLVAAVTRWAVEELALAPGREVQAVFKATACHWISSPG